MPATQTRTAAPSRLLGASAAEFEFRIQGGEHDGRILRIAGAKCTIGSARGCTLRLRGYGIEPLHCLLLAGRNGTVVRRNSPRTYLNGGGFEDAALKTGDVLRIGPVELAVVACPRAVSGLQGLGAEGQQTVQAPAESADFKRDQQRHAAELAALGEELRAAHEQLEQARQANLNTPAEHTQTVNQLREQYTEALERFLSQQREERVATAAREEQFQNELSQARQKALEQETRFAEREAAFLQLRLEGQRLEEKTTDLTARLFERENQLVQREAELAGVRQRTARQSPPDELVKQLEEKLQSTILAQQVEREAWKQEKTRLEAAKSDLVACQTSVGFQAALDQEVSARCESLERQIAELQTRLQQALAANPVEPAAVGQLAAQKFELQIERWQSEARTWQLQAVEIESQLCEMKQLCARQEAEIAGLQAAAHADGLAAAESHSLDALRSQLEMQGQELADARAQFQEQQAQLGPRLAEASLREEAVARLQVELREREAAWESVRAEQASDLEERSHLIASQIAQFEAEQAAFSRQQAAIIRQMSALEERVQELTTSGESRTTNSPFVIPRKDDPSLRGDLESATQPYVRAGARPRIESDASRATQLLESPAAKIAAPTPPEATVEPPPEVSTVVDRVAQAGPWKGNESESQVQSEPPAPAPVPQKPASTPLSFLGRAAEMVRQEELDGTPKQPEVAVPPPAAPVQAHAASSPLPGGTADDDSIEQYMNRLLSRVRGSATPAASAPEVDEEEPASAPSPDSAPAEMEKPAEAKETKEYVSRAAPEQPERLSLMRELANSAAQSAIHTHARQHQKRETKHKSLVAMLSLIGAVGLFVVAFVTHSPIAMAGSMIFIAICCVMSMRALAGSLRQMRLTRPQEIGDVPEVAPSVPKSDEKAGPA